MDDWIPILVGIIPSIGVGLVFWYAMRSVVRADRNERAELARADAAMEEENAAAARTEPSSE